MWISVLEDEAVLNNLITKYLQKEGYSVRSYLRGEDAVQGLDKPTDLWVIDIMLPDIDGFTVFREVQRKNPNSYVIFISARNQPGWSWAGTITSPNPFWCGSWSSRFSGC